MNPTLTLEMVVRRGQACYVDPHGAEVYVVPAEIYERLLPHLSEPMQPPAGPPAHEHVWGAPERVGGTHLVRMRCTIADCGAVSYGHVEEG